MSNAVINNNAHAGVFSGGTDIGATVNKGGVLYVHSGGTAANTTVKSGGLEVLETGDPEAIAAFVKSHAPHVARIGLETGATATWLWTELNKLGLPIICHRCQACQGGSEDADQQERP